MNQQTVLFDLDDTLLQTNKLFTERISKVKKLMSDSSGMPLKKVSEIFEKSLVRAYSEVSVNPVNEWPTTFKYIETEIPLSKDVLDKCIQTLYSIYKTAPEIVDGAVEILEYFNLREYKVGLVTHAIEDWTHLKLDTHGLKKYFSHIEICDVNRHKDKDDWKRAFTAFNTHPSKGLIIGDNVKGDIIAGHTIGVRRLIWVNNNAGWKVYLSGDIPKGTIEVKNLFEIIPILEAKGNNK